MLMGILLNSSLLNGTIFLRKYENGKKKNVPEKSDKYTPVLTTRARTRAKTRSRGQDKPESSEWRYVYDFLRLRCDGLT